MSTDRHRPPRREHLSYEAYAEARGRCEPMDVAARAAGSKAESRGALVKTAYRIETDPRVREMIRAARSRYVAETTHAFELAKARALETLEREDMRSLWPKAWDFLAKIRGEYAPERHLVGHVHTVADLVRSLEDADALGVLPPRSFAAIDVLPSPPPSENGNGHANGNGRE